MQINHEILKIAENNLPVQITFRKSNQNSQGCFYHWHEELELYYVVSGGINLLCNGSNRWIYAGDIALINWCEPHKSLNFLDQTTHYIIQIKTDSSLLKAINGFKNFPNFFNKSEKINKLLNTMIKEYETKQKGSEQMIIGTTILLLATLNRISHNHEQGSQQNNLIYIKKILEYIHDNFTADISLDDIAEQLRISKPHMCRIFKTHTGITIGSYISKIRFNLAVSLISEGHSVTETSELVGFDDYNYFSRNFKKTMGYLPSSIKKRL